MSQQKQNKLTALKTILLSALCFATCLIPVAHAGTITYLHNDALGSAVAATNEQGEVLWQEAYRPYGERIRKEAGNTHKVWFTGKPEEATFGLSYFGARWYDPKVGRFMAIDPVGFKEGNIQSFNRYAYANNNPYKYVDPDGRELIDAIGDDDEGFVGGSSNPKQEFTSEQLEAIFTVATGPFAPEALAFAKGFGWLSKVTKGAGELQFGRKLDFLFNKNINPANPKNVQRARGNADRIGIADTPANRAEVTRRFNEAFNDPSSIVGPGKAPGSNIREFFLPGVTGTGSKIQFIEQGGKVITIIAK